MKNFPTIEVKEDLGLYSDDELKFIAKELHIENYDILDRDGLIESINKSQTKSTVNDILRKIDSLNSVTGLSGVLVDFWFRALAKRKWLTIISTLVFFASLTLTIVYFDSKSQREMEEVKKESLNLESRITDLENMESNLKELIVFIENQKEAIVETENSLSALEKKKNELEPIVKTQEETIAAILDQQEKRNWNNRWVERLIGFGLGIAASICASIIYGLIKRIKTPLT